MALEAETKGKVEALRMKKNLRLMFWIWELLLSMPMLLMQRAKRTSSLFSRDLEMSRPNLKRKIELRLLLKIILLQQTADAMQTKMLLRSPALSLSRLTETGA